MWKLGLKPRAIPRKGIHTGIFVAVRSVSITKLLNQCTPKSALGGLLSQHKFSFLRDRVSAWGVRIVYSHVPRQASHQLISVGCSPPPPPPPPPQIWGPPPGLRSPYQVLIHKWVPTRDADCTKRIIVVEVYWKNKLIFNNMAQLKTTITVALHSTAF